MRPSPAEDDILFETGDRHSEGTWPRPRSGAHRTCVAAGLDGEEVHRLPCGHAIASLGLRRFGIAS